MDASSRSGRVTSRSRLLRISIRTDLPRTPFHRLFTFGVRHSVPRYTASEQQRADTEPNTAPLPACDNVQQSARRWGAHKEWRQRRRRQTNVSRFAQQALRCRRRHTVGIQSATSSAQREATDSRHRSGLLARGIHFCREQQRNDQAGGGQAIASGMVSVTLVSQNHENIHASKQSLVVRVAVLRPASPAPTP